MISGSMYLAAFKAWLRSGGHDATTNRMSSWCAADTLQGITLHKGGCSLPQSSVADACFFLLAAC